MSTVLVTVLVAVALVVLVVLAVLSRVKVAGPNEAYIITGRKGQQVRNTETGRMSTDMSGQKVVLGASVFVLPLVQKLGVLDLSSRRIPVGIRGAVSAQGVKCDLEGVAIVKVGGSEDAIRAAAQRFLEQQDEVDTFTSEVLAGSLRAIAGRLSIDEIIKDRAAFASAVAEEAEISLTNQGLSLDTFQLQDIQAEGSYLADLGRPEAARVQKEATIAEARARQAAEQERFLAEEAVAISERQLALKQAEISAEIDAAKADAASAGPLAQAAKDQQILFEEEKVAERRAALKERELDTEVRKPADAARYRVEQEAEAAKRQAILEAEARRQGTIEEAEAAARKAELSGQGEKARRAALAEAERLEGEKRGEAERLRREAVAQAVVAEGRADAAATLARGEAEAGALDAKARAFEEFGQAAVLDLVVRMLPEVVRASAEPLASVDRMTIISADGPSSLARSVAGGVEQGIQLGTDLTGIDLRSLLQGVTAKTAAAGAEAAARVEEAQQDGADAAAASAPSPRT